MRDEEGVLREMSPPGPYRWEGGSLWHTDFLSTGGEERYVWKGDPGDMIKTALFILIVWTKSPLTIRQIILILLCGLFPFCSGLLVRHGPPLSLEPNWLCLSLFLHSYHYSSPRCPTHNSLYLSKRIQYLELLRTSSFPEFLSVVACITILSFYQNLVVTFQFSPLFLLPISSPLIYLLCSSPFPHSQHYSPRSTLWGKRTWNVLSWADPKIYMLGRDCCDVGPFFLGRGGVSERSWV